MNGKEFQMQEFPVCVEWAEQVARKENLQDKYGWTKHLP